MAKFNNGDFVKVSGSERVYVVDKLLQTQKQTIPFTADLEIYQLVDEDGEAEVATGIDLELVKNSIEILKQHSQEVCGWKCNIGTEAWSEWGDCGDYSSDCGLEWNMSNHDSPIENSMNFCPKCGKKLVEVKPPSEVQDDKPSD